MLTIRTSAHIPTNRHRRGPGFCRVSGRSPARAGASAWRRDWLNLLNSNARRLWLQECWKTHRAEVQLIKATRRK